MKIGRTGDAVYSFSKNDDEKYVKEGNLEDVKMKLHVKYAMEGSFSFDVASV
jgi:hypothetical protein